MFKELDNSLIDKDIQGSTQEYFVLSLKKFFDEHT